MSRQYIRNIRLLVGNSEEMHDWSNLKIVFEVKRVQTVNPDRCMISIYNLPEDLIIRALEKFTNIQLEVGYDDKLDIIYSGEITYWRNYWADNLVDRITTIFSAQNQRAFQYAYVKTTQESGATPDTIKDEMINSWVKLGASKDPSGKDLIVPGTAYPRGQVLFGRTQDYARTLGRDCNKIIKLRNGKPYLASRTDPDLSNIIKLNYNTGLLKQPEIVELGINCVCLLNPAISSGGVVHIDTKDIIAPMPDKDTHVLTGFWGMIASSGLYYILEVTHKGDTWGKDWYSTFLASVIQNLGQVNQVQD